MCSKSSSHSRGGILWWKCFPEGSCSAIRDIRRSVAYQPTGDLDLNGVCPEELDVGVVVVQEGNDETPGLISFLDKFEQLDLQSA